MLPWRLLAHNSGQSVLEVKNHDVFFLTSFSGLLFSAPPSVRPSQVSSSISLLSWTLRFRLFIRSKSRVPLTRGTTVSVCLLHRRHGQGHSCPPGFLGHVSYGTALARGGGRTHTNLETVRLLLLLPICLSFFKPEGSSTQYSVMDYMRKESEKSEYMYVDDWFTLLYSWY